MEDYEIGRKRRGNVLGSIFDNHGYWYWRVKFPGAGKRVAVPLKLPSANHAMPSTKSRRDVLSAAWREWERVTGRRDEYRLVGNTVNDICDAWVAHMQEYYRRADGTRTSEAANASIGVRMFRTLHGSRFIGDLGHGDRRALRNAIVQTGVARKTVNRYMQIVIGVRSNGPDRAIRGCPVPDHIVGQCPGNGGCRPDARPFVLLPCLGISLRDTGRIFDVAIHS